VLVCAKILQEIFSDRLSHAMRALRTSKP
jgi:hypothetical protein